MIARGRFEVLSEAPTTISRGCPQGRQAISKKHLLKMTIPSFRVNSLSPKNLTLCLGILGAVILIANRGQIEVRNFFAADDWYWLYLAHFADLNVFSVLPDAVYNDRPVGAIAIRLLYAAFGLDSKAFLWAQLGIHAVNCALLFFIGARYIGRPAALLAAALAGSWLVANNAVFWTAAMFDLLGATFCLLSILLWQLSLAGKRRVLLLALASLSYFLATRTKEFAIGLPAVLFLLSTMVEQRSIRKTFVEQSGFVAVMVLMVSRYAWLLYTSKSRFVGATDTPYGLHFDGIAPTLWHYITKVFYAQEYGLWWAPIAVFLLLGLAAWMRPLQRNLILVCLAGFVILLGPTLLLSAHRDDLYLYAPHFFLALAIASAASVSAAWAGVTVIIAVLLAAVPYRTQHGKNVSAFYLQKTSMIRAQFVAFDQLVGNLPGGSTVVIGGLEPYHNPFSYGPGNSVKIKEDDASLKFVVEKLDTELRSEFCSAPFPKIFITFAGGEAKVETAAALLSCGSQPTPSTLP